jgi:ATP-binding cassette subfamily F protein 3
LDKSDTVYDTLDKVAVGDIRFRLKDILGSFLFHGEDVDKKVAVLSGGERSRLAMAKLIVRPHNLLALDEPTNHMDIRSKEVVKNALKRFDGTLIIVSHDRAFLDGLVDVIYEFRDGEIRKNLGGIDDFMRRKKIESMAEFEREEIELKVANEKKDIAKEISVNAEGTMSREKQREERRKENKRKRLESEIDKLERKMKEMESVLSAPTPQTDIMQLTRDYLELKRDVDAKTDEWASL